MKTNKYLILITFYIIHSAFYIVAEATVRYVSKTGSSTPPYTSWATAADSIQKCINICVDGDTIYVANGVYYETVVINKILTIIGSSMDSTIIDGRYFQNQTIIRTSKHLNISNIFIRCAWDVWWNDGISYLETTGNVNNCRFERIREGSAVYLMVSSVNVSNCFFRDVNTAIDLICIEDTCQGTYSNNIIYSRVGFPAVNFPYGGSITFTNNIVIEEYESLNGVQAYVKEITAIGNLVANFERLGFSIASTTGNGNLHLFNNTVSNIYSPLSGNAYGVRGNPNTILKNNIATKSNRGFSIVYSPNVIIDYNLLWDVRHPSNGTVPLGDSNLINIDPMFVKDTIARYGGSWDYHLQAYSPAIDKGDPTILDRDGSRSDIGMYGGPFGEIYTYQDLAPRPPRNLSAVVDSNRVRLKWKKNTEADTSHYNIYRSTTANFIIDSTKLIGSTRDTNYVDILTQTYERLYYKITCVDKQGNQSMPSEELPVNFTSISEYPSEVRDYYLYQNYPNPFNPTTKIGYKLKDRGYVKLMVYDIKGERIAVLVNQEQEAGYYEVEFGVGNGLLSVPQRGIASGIYLYRIEVIGEGNIPVYTEMRKMILLK